MITPNTQIAKKFPRPTATDGWLSRERVVALALLVVSVIVFYLCYCLLVPFLPSLAWALALAVMGHPLHHWIKVRLPYFNVAAGLSVVLVGLIVVAPVIFVTQNLLGQADTYIQKIEDELTSGRWRAVLEQNKGLKRLIPWIETKLGIRNADQNAETTSTDPEDPAATTAADAQAVTQVEQAVSMLDQSVTSFVTGTIWAVAQLFITFLALFFFFRDRAKGLRLIRSLLPLSNEEIDEVFKRVQDTIHVTLYGSLVVAFVQGLMGGLMFWWLGLPSPLFWGAVMGLLAVVPVLGTFVIWAPTAAFLALHGDFKSALILTAWGSIAIGLIDNVLHPFLVGKRLRFHTLLVFFSIAGGLLVFGASGIILGPLLLATTDALLDVWHRRTAFGGTIEGGVEPS